MRGSLEKDLKSERLLFLFIFCIMIDTGMWCWTPNTSHSAETFLWSLLCCLYLKWYFSFPGILWSSRYLPVHSDNIVSKIRWHIVNTGFKDWFKASRLHPPRIFEFPNRRIIKRAWSRLVAPKIRPHICVLTVLSVHEHKYYRCIWIALQHKNNLFFSPDYHTIH